MKEYERLRLMADTLDQLVQADFRRRNRLDCLILSEPPRNERGAHRLLDQLMDRTMERSRYLRAKADTVELEELRGEAGKAGA